MEQQPDFAKLKALAQTPAGQQLYAALRRCGDQSVQDAARQAAQGDYTQMQTLLRSLLSDPESQALLKHLEEQL